MKGIAQFIRWAPFRLSWRLVILVTLYVFAPWIGRLIEAPASDVDLARDAALAAIIASFYVHASARAVRNTLQTQVRQGPGLAGVREDDVKPKQG